MANRIIQLTEVDSLPTSNQKLEKWVDIDMDATRNQNHDSKYEMPMLSDYVVWLATEMRIPTPPDSSLSAFATEGQNLANPPDNVISAVAVVVSAGYDVAYSNYQRWFKPYKWRVSKLVNVKAVQNSLKNIFTWTPGERILNPEFGNRLREYLYQGIIPETSEQIVAEIRHCVSEWEPRVNITDVVDVSTTDDHEDNTIHLEIRYTIPELSDEQYSYSFYYNRGE